MRKAIPRMTVLTVEVKNFLAARRNWWPSRSVGFCGELRCFSLASQFIDCHPERSWRPRSEGQRSRRTPYKPVVVENTSRRSCHYRLGRESFDCGTASHSRSGSFAQDDSDFGAFSVSPCPGWMESCSLQGVGLQPHFASSYPG